jgi:hypothetical protein
VGLSVRNYRRAFKRAVEDAGLAALGLDLHSPHDLRATFATWLEGAAIPTRATDELMGHASGSGDRGTSRMGALYRETTPEMLARVTAALDERLTKAEQAALPLMREFGGEAAGAAPPTPSTGAAQGLMARLGRGPDRC